MNEDRFVTKAVGKRYDTKEINSYRKALLNNVTGEILELGICNGINLPYYPVTTQHITGIDRVMRNLIKSSIHVDHYYCEYSQLPFEDNSFDTIVVFFTLDQIMEPQPIIDEMKRVLKSRGRLLLLECGKSENKRDAFLQEVLNPMWEVFARRSLNRDYFELLQQHKFIFATKQKQKVKLNPQSLVGTLYAGVAVNMK